MSTSEPTVGRTPKGGRSASRLLAAATTVLARDGFGGATLGRIADEADMDKRSIVYYFGSREALLVRVVQIVGERIAQRIEPERDPAGDVVGLVDQNIDALWSAITSAPELARAYFALLGGGTETGEVKSALLALKDAYLDVARDQIAAITPTSTTLARRAVTAGASAYLPKEHVDLLLVAAIGEVASRQPSP